MRDRRLEAQAGMRTDKLQPFSPSAEALMRTLPEKG